MSRQVKKTNNGKEFADYVKSLLQWLMKMFGRLGELLTKTWSFLRLWIRKAWQGVKDLKRSFLRSFARWSDPKLEPYREHKRRSLEEKVVVEEATYVATEPKVPETREDLFALIREAPMSVLTGQERKAMAAVLDLPEVAVSEVMTPVGKMVFVKQDETMGPLVLDRLYRSGFTYFPVMDSRQHIIGMLHTALLNSLDVKELHRAEEVMDPRVYYLRMDYNLEQSLKAFLRTGSQAMLVVDRYEKLVGVLTFSQVMSFLFDEKFRDDFDRDDDRAAVAKRR